MGKINGTVSESLQALIYLEFFANGKFESLSCEVDTGFAGTIMLPRETVSKFQLEIDGQEYFKAVEDTEFLAETTRLTIRWLDDEFEITAIISEHNYALISAEMLIDAVLTIDYLNKTVLIEK